MSDVTRILDAIGQGDPKAVDQLLPLVYQELRKVAAYKMAGEPPGQTLQPTALVHEAWLKLVGQGDRKWQDRNHFFAASAEAMRRILVDNARRKRTQPTAAATCESIWTMSSWPSRTMTCSSRSTTPWKNLPSPINKKPSWLSSDISSG